MIIVNSILLQSNMATVCYIRGPTSICGNYRVVLYAKEVTWLVGALLWTI